MLVVLKELNLCSSIRPIHVFLLSFSLPSCHWFHAPWVCRVIFLQATKDRFNFVVVKVALKVLELVEFVR